jgi:hypothetical protein
MVAEGGVRSESAQIAKALAPEMRGFRAKEGPTPALVASRSKLKASVCLLLARSPLPGPGGLAPFSTTLERFRW